MRATLAAALLVVLAACTSTVEAPIGTDRSAYIVGSGEFGPELKIISTLRAPGGRAVHVANCNGAITPGLQRRVGDRWVDAWIAATDACASSPIVIPPGDTHTAELLIRTGAGAVTYPRPNNGALESGTYRVVWHGTDIPLEQRVSAPITIEAPPIAAPPSTPPIASTPPPQMPPRRVASANVSGQVGDEIRLSQVLTRTTSTSQWRRRARSSSGIAAVTATRPRSARSSSASTNPAPPSSGASAAPAPRAKK